MYDEQLGFETATYVVQRATDSPNRFSRQVERATVRPLVSLIWSSRQKEVPALWIIVSQCAEPSEALSNHGWGYKSSKRKLFWRHRHSSKLPIHGIDGIPGIALMTSEKAYIFCLWIFFASRGDLFTVSKHIGNDQNSTVSTSKNGSKCDTTGHTTSRTSIVDMLTRWRSSYIKFRWFSQSESD